MKDYVLDGRVLWSHLFQPDSMLGSPEYLMYFNTDESTLLRLAEEDIKVSSIKYQQDKRMFCVKISSPAYYADNELAPPPIFDKDKNPIVLNQELPNFHKVKVKFSIHKGQGIYFGKKKLTLKAVMLLEDLPHPFDNVESF